MAGVLALATLVLGVGSVSACSRRALIASCDDDVRGVYSTGPEGAGPWMVLDNGRALEAYALFPDGDAASDVVAAPRVIDLVRAGSDGLTGTLHRRYMRRQDSCDAQVPVRVTRCAGDTLDVVLADPSPPLAFAPCEWPRPGPSRLVHWRRD